MITLPAEISNYKNKNQHSLISFFEIPSRNFYFASQEIYLVLSSGTGAAITYDVGRESYILIDFASDFSVFSNSEVVYYAGNYYEISEIIDENRIEINFPGPNQTGVAYNIERYYKDLLRKGSNNYSKDSIPEMVNGINSFGTGKIELLDFRNSVRMQLLGTDPDLTAVSINFFIKYNTSNRLRSEALNFFNAYISDWSESSDVIRLSIKIDDALYRKQFMTNKLSNSPFSRNRDYYVPKQFGDFGGDLEDIQYWADWVNNNFAFCPISSAEIVEGFLQYRFEVSSHQMAEMPAYTEINAQRHQARIFQHYDGMFHSPTSTRFDSKVGYVVNNSSGSYFLLDYDHSDQYNLNHTMLHPTEINETSFLYANTVANWLHAIDGKVSTVLTMNANEVLSVQNFETKKISAARNYEGTGFNKLEVWVQFGSVNLGTGTATLKIVDKSDEITVVASYGITAGDADRSIVLDKAGLNSGYEADNFFFVIETSAGVTSVQVKNIIAFIYTKGMDNDQHPYLFLRCKGTMYSSNWESRKTTGALIENPIDLIEGILRDYCSQTNFDTDRFDEINYLFSSIKICRSFYQSTTIEELISDFCSAFNASIFLSNGRWRVVSPIINSQIYPVSGTSTPGNFDTITDTDILANTTFNKNAILRKSFSLSRTDSRDICNKLIINHTEIYGSFYASNSSGSGNKETEINNSYISNSTFAGILLTLLLNWNTTQKMIVELTTFYSMIGHEIGDIVNIEHADLSASIVSASTLQLQEWMIINIKKNYHPAQIDLILVELL